MVLKLFQLFVSICFTYVCNCQILPPAGVPVFRSPNDPCMDVKNLSQTMTLPNHQYVVLENCLYYQLQQRASSSNGQLNSLAALPPPPSAGDGATNNNVTIHIFGHLIQNIWVNDFMKDLRVRGVMFLSWFDSRLVWDPNEFKLTSTNIQSAAHIWVPQVNSDKYDSSVGNSDTVEYKKIKAYNNGTVTASMNYNLQTICDIDTENYPADTHTCCMKLKVTLFENMVDFQSAFSRSFETKIDTRFIRDNNDGYVTRFANFKNFYDENGASTINWCLTLTRSNGALRIELATPMAICAVLLFVAPLFGTLKSQLYVKLFILLLQYLCLQFLANKLTHLGSIATPKIFRFYEFSIVINLLSIVLTLIFSVLSAKQRNLPPPQALVNCAGKLNKIFCCCISKKSEEEKETSVNEWVDVFGGMHNLVMFFIFVVYLIGILVIYS